MSTTQKKHVGRKAGQVDNSFLKKIEKRVGVHLDIILRKADAGDIEAIQLCWNILKNPKDYPEAVEEPFRKKFSHTKLATGAQ